MHDAWGPAHVPRTAGPQPGLANRHHPFGPQSAVARHGMAGTTGPLGAPDGEDVALPAAEGTTDGTAAATLGVADGAGGDVPPLEAGASQPATSHAAGAASRIPRSAPRRSSIP